MIDQTSIDALAAQVPDGALVAMPAEQSFVSMAMVRALIQRGVRDMHLLCVPIGSLAADMLIGAGCVSTIECAAVSLGEFGLAPRFSAAVEEGKVRIIDSTCPAIHAALQAGEKGIPFMPLTGLIGTDILANRDDWKVVDDPLGKGNGPVVLLPAIRPDFAIFHAPLADKFGDVWIGRRRELVPLAHAAKTTLVTAERITDEKLVASDTMAAGTLPNIYIGGIAQARRGAKPLGLPGYYPADTETYRTYARMARTEEGFLAFLDDFLAGDMPEDMPGEVTEAAE
ncbi:MAG: CoA synthetase [Rhodospirillaceae bacterium]|nr:CoA synthetase [Rhodospirillaceae bacterium]